MDATTSAQQTPLHAPTLVIQPTRGWSQLALAELWRYRELLWFLTTGIHIRGCGPSPLSRSAHRKPSTTHALVLALPVCGAFVLRRSERNIVDLL